MYHLLEVMKDYKTINKCLPGNSEYWINKITEAYEADNKSIPMQLPVKPEIAEEELRTLFRNNSDCYADTWRTENDGSWHEGKVIQALTEDKFIEIVKKQFSV